MSKLAVTGSSVTVNGNAFGVTQYEVIETVDQIETTDTASGTEREYDTGLGDASYKLTLFWQDTNALRPTGATLGLSVGATVTTTVVTLGGTDLFSMDSGKIFEVHTLGRDIKDKIFYEVTIVKSSSSALTRPSNA